MCRPHLIPAVQGQQFALRTVSKWDESSLAVPVVLIAYTLASALTLSKLYSNSLMMLFNNRTRMRTLRGGIHTGSGNRLMLSTSGPSDLESSHGEDTTGGRARPQEIALRKLPMVGYRADVGSTVDGFDDRSDSDMHKVSTP